MVGEIERDAAVAAADRIDSAPDQLAGREEHVQVAGPERLDPRSQHLAVQRARDQRSSLELLDGGEERIDPAARPRDPLPVHQEASERRRLHRLHLLAQPRQRPPLERLEDLGVDPFPAAATGQELSLEHALLGREPLERGAHHPHAGSPARRQVLDPERAVRPRPARDQVAERILHRLEQLARETRGRRHAERVAHPRRILRGHPPLLAGQVGGKRAALLEQLLQRRIAFMALPDLRFREIPQREQEVVQAVDSVRRTTQPLRGVLVLFDRAGVEQLAHLRLAQKLPELCLVDRERLGPPLGQRSVAVVDEVRDVVEEQGRREWRGSARVHRERAQAAVLHPPQDVLEAGEVEDVAEAFPVRLEQHGKAAVAGGDLEEIPRALPLRPERAAAAGVAAGQEQRSRRVLPEAGGEERRGPERLRDQVLDLVGLWKEQLRLGRGVRLRDAEDHSVVRPHRLDLDPAILLEPAHHRCGPGRVHARAEGREHADPPVAHLVQVALDHDGLVAGYLAGRVDLIVQVPHQVRRRALVETDLA